MTIGNNACFTPIRIGTKTATNRFVVSRWSSRRHRRRQSRDRGNPTKRTLNRYRNLFTGGAGLIVLEAISVGDTSMARTHQLTILPATPRRSAPSSPNCVRSTPSRCSSPAHPFRRDQRPLLQACLPKQMAGFESDLLSDEDADRIIDEFVEAAKIAHDVGLDGLDIKFCHGYLGAQILRPYNDRKWKYGGPKENRFRFGYEIYERVMKAVNDPAFILGSKVTLYEAIRAARVPPGPTRQ